MITDRDDGHSQGYISTYGDHTTTHRAQSNQKKHVIGASHLFRDFVPATLTRKRPYQGQAWSQSPEDQRTSRQSHKQPKKPPAA